VRVISVALLAAVLLTSGPSAQTSSPLRGFSRVSSARELELERAFTQMPSAKVAEADFDVMTAEPHHVGSPYEIHLADYVADTMASFGLEVARYEYSVLVPWPGARRIDVLQPDPMSLAVEEETIPGDRWASQPGILPAYNAYSPAGDVTADIVYVNYGMPGDYETLAKQGVDVAGKIVLVRYGGGWRGIKPKVAAEHGAVGCLIYSDPRDDGYFQGDPYPAGALRGAGMIQRGSVMDMPRYPGDPATPGRPSKPGVERIPLDRIETLSPIPVQPLSSRDGLELLKRLRGPVAPEAWRGALPLTYHLGPGPAKVHLHLEMDYGQRRLINVVGTIRGRELPDEWVVVGSHRDAWVYGASDSVSAHVSMMSVARAFGDMMKQGWRPRRTIVFVSWDGEEPGLLGSTEWVEDLGAELAAKAAIYINRDGGASGPYFTASAVHSLTPFTRELAQSVQADDPALTLYDRWLERLRDQAPAHDGPLPEPTPGALGSGSDYVAFLDHIGVPALDLSINARNDTGTYHSTYDNPAWFKTFIDPQFKYSVLAAQMTGIATLRFAEAELLPFDYQAYGRQIREYIDEIERQATASSAEKARRVDFSGLRAAADAFTKAGARLAKRGESALDRPAPEKWLDLNHRLIAAERDLLEPAGLPDRPWYKHTVYAPGQYTGYGVKTLPGVREAIEAGNFTRAAEQAAVVIRALGRATRTLNGD